VDGGSRLSLDALSADVRLRAIGADGGVGLQVALAGDAATAMTLGLIPVEAAPAVVVDVLQVIAAHSNVRAADVLKTNGIAAFAPVRHLRPHSAPHKQRAIADVIGLHPLGGDSFARGIGLAFGHAHADPLMQLVHAARGARAVRPAPGRALLLIGFSKSDA